MKLKCISPRLNYIVFGEDGKPHRIQPGETFEVKAKKLPAKWNGLVTEVEAVGPKVSVTNPSKPSK